jgi:hypothetical protein
MQLRDCIPFHPVNVYDLTLQEHQRALESIFSWWKSVMAKLKVICV